MPEKKLTEIEQQEIYKLYKLGKNKAEIARIIGIDRTTIIYYLKSESYENHRKIHNYDIRTKRIARIIKKPEIKIIEKDGKKYRIEKEIVNPKTGKILLPATTTLIAKTYADYKKEENQRAKKNHAVRSEE